jgi:SDR family mycofactocin-dependent oxidoreductase
MADGEQGRPLAGRVALITGGGRGQGRSHAVALAKLGADIAVCDLCRDVPAVGYPMATEEDLAETVALVTEEGRHCRSGVVDVRDLGAMVAFVASVRDELESVDVLVANAGVAAVGSVCTMSASDWSEVVDINLGGVFNAMRAVAPHMRRQRHGRIIAISSMMGRSANPGAPAYVASKWGVIGLSKAVALELAGVGVTVNVVAPGNVSTDMIHNESLYKMMRPDLEHPTRDDVAGPMALLHAQPVPWIEPEDVTAAVVFLASDAARHITGSVIDVDAGASARFTA